MRQRWRRAERITDSRAYARTTNYFGAFVLDPDGHNIEAVCDLAIG